MHQAIKYHLDKSVLTSHYQIHDEETLSKVFTVNNSSSKPADSTEIQINSKMEFLPKEQCQKVLFLYAILLHDINPLNMIITDPIKGKENSFVSMN